MATENTRPVPRRALSGIPPYPLGEATVPGVARVIELASNECAVNPSPHAIAACQAATTRLHRYPDGSAGPLRKALARLHGIEAERIVCGAGSEELISLLTTAYAEHGDEVVVAQYGYLLYARTAQIAGATVVVAPGDGVSTGVEALLAAVTPRTRLLFLANPNNPTGVYLPAGVIEQLHRGLPGSVLLVLDAAYAEYVARADYEPGLALARNAANVVMLRTFSKAYGLASLRVGWLYGPSEVVSVLHRVRLPTNVSTAAQAAAAAALADTDHLAGVVARNETNRTHFIAGLRGLGLEPQPSEGNFVLVRFPGEPSRDAGAAYRFLRSRGILARPMHPYQLDAYLRFTIGTAGEMHAVLNALVAFLD